MSSISDKLKHKHPHYFEAILQLRDVSLPTLAFVHQELEREQLHIVKEVSYPRGLDLYLTDQKFTRKLGKILQQQFGGDFLVTTSLHTRKEGRDIYRFTVLFRGILFKKGDTVLYQGEEHTVTALGKDILLKNTASKKKVHVKWKEMQEVHRK